ncbi:MAG TPA: polysaccharide biosynthesis tyrosine autokinase [Flavobacteriaceae bacterium]|nr:polysaccharide biosynthesis tyrosine autokinase [Flavobacteriaceae bacterium]
MENPEITKPELAEPNLREQIYVYLRYWPWFIISAIVLMALSVIYLRYATPIYETKATILIKDEKNSALSELALFQDLGFTGSLSPSGFENEIQILKSKSLTERVVKELHLNVSYVSEGKVRDTELYENVPIKVEIITPEDEIIFPATPLYVLPINSKKYQLTVENVLEGAEFSFGEVVKLPFAEITVLATEHLNFTDTDNSPEEIRVNIYSLNRTVAAYRQNIQVDRLMDMSSVIQLTLNLPNSNKARAILNELIKQYNQDAMEDRNIVARNTANFINGRLLIISEELDSVETGKVEFKQSNRLTDLKVEGELFLRNESEYAKRAMEVDVQLELIASMIDYVRKANETDLLPTNLGFESDRVASNVQNYNQVVLERSRLLGSSTEKNPAVVVLTDQLRGLRANVMEGLSNAKTALEIQKNDILKQGAKIDTKIGSAPSKEKIFRSISRQQEIKETLYLYLLQKREENAISMAVTTPKAKVVDYAFSSLAPVSPKKNIIFLAAFILGLLIPFGVIYLRNLLDDKVREKSDILAVNKDNPIIGEIPKLDKKEEQLVQINDRSVLAESFRMLRTNLQYLIVPNKEEDEGKIIFVTSTIKGEGKTFCSFNLALTLANAGSKVVLVGSDTRNPQIHRYAPSKSYRNGVVEYLINEDSSIFDYLTPSEMNGNLTLMYSGTIPPNPAELWLRPRAEELFAELKKEFDYVVVDTAPTLLVTDTFLISRFADVILYVMRAGFTERRLLEFPMTNIKSKKLQNVAFVINDVSMDKIGYGNKYGYYYVSRNSFWKRFRRSFGLS